MNVLLTILLGYAVLFFLLAREGVEVRENLQAFGFMMPAIDWVIGMVNRFFGTEFSDEAWIPVWAVLFFAWTLVAIWFLIGAYWQRRKQAQLWRQILRSEGL